MDIETAIKLLIEKRETEIEQLKKQQKKTKKKIAIVSFITGALTWHIVQLSFSTLLHRSGTIGGEVLVLPLLGCIFYLGWMCRSEIEKK